MASKTLNASQSDKKTRANALPTVVGPGETASQQMNAIDIGMPTRKPQAFLKYQATFEPLICAVDGFASCSFGWSLAWRA